MGTSTKSQSRSDKFGSDLYTDNLIGEVNVDNNCFEYRNKEGGSDCKAKMAAACDHQNAIFENNNTSSYHLLANEGGLSNGTKSTFDGLVSNCSSSSCNDAAAANAPCLSAAAEKTLQKTSLMIDSLLDHGDRDSCEISNSK